jgi:hypothetical protein
VFFANIELNFIPAIPAANANPPPTISPTPLPISAHLDPGPAIAPATTLPKGTRPKARPAMNPPSTWTRECWVQSSGVVVPGCASYPAELPAVST